MKLTEDEKEICRQYGARDDDGTVHCFECPLVIDKREFICKANCTAEEWTERKDNARKNDK